jgi:PAS domain-containing protein
MMLLLGGAVLAIFALILGAYLLQRYLSHTLNPQEPKPPRLRVDDEAAFTLATVKGVVTELKSEQKAAQEKLLGAERRAEENARKFELLAGEIDYGLMIFDSGGFVTFSNPLARKVLAVDTWSRRRYGEVFRDIPDLSGLIGECFETGTETRKKTVEFSGPDGNTRRVEVSVLTTHDRFGAMEAVACLSREVAPAAPDA